MKYPNKPQLTRMRLEETKTRRELRSVTLSAGIEASVDDFRKLALDAGHPAEEVEKYCEKMRADLTRDLKL